MGYAAIADLGMQQALVRMVADRHALDAHDEIDRLVSTTVATFAALGVLGAAGLVALSDAFTSWFGVEDGLKRTRPSSPSSSSASSSPSTS